MKSFVLAGNDCVYGRFPAPVIPIGYMNRRLAAIYPGNGDSPQIELLKPSCKFNRHSETLRKRLSAFDPNTDRLFAYSSTVVRFYDAKREQEFFHEFLLDEAWRDCDPFIRLLLAKQVGIPVLIQAEVEACFQMLTGTAPNTAAAWYQNELAGIAKHKASSREVPTDRERSAGLQKSGHSLAIRPRLLIVEDQDDFRDVLADKFRSSGFNVSVACDGDQAIEQIATENPEIILLDLMLPRLSGFEVLQHIREVSPARKTPVVIVSALPQATYGKTARQLGASRYVTKPAGLPTITSAVQSLVAKVR